MEKTNLNSKNNNLIHFNTQKQDTTDLTLFVRTSSEDVSSRNRNKIVEALIRET